MRVCPKCGYSENLLWQQHRFAANLMFMRIEDFENEFPELFDKFKEGQKDVVDGDFIYHKTKNYVKRLEITGGSVSERYEQNCHTWSAMSMNRIVRKYNELRSKNQTKLLEVNQK